MSTVDKANNIINIGQKIAKFMGSKPIKLPDVNVLAWDGDFAPLQGKLFFPNNLLFHKDWNWIMLVIAKFQNIARENSEARNQLRGYDFIGWSYKFGVSVSDNQEGVFNELECFIDWYEESQDGFILLTNHMN